MHLDTIGVAHTPFRQKFGIPRQSIGLHQVPGRIELLGEYANPLAVKGLTQFSHIWLTFGFHQHIEHNWQAQVRPPRLGGNEKLGVFASRSSFRPNNLGLSVVELINITCLNDTVTLFVNGVDLLDQTPIYDIKPYIAYADSLPQAQCGYAAVPPETVELFITPQAQTDLVALQANYPDLHQVIQAVFSQDPRPAYKGQTDPKTYRLQLFDLDCAWRYQDGKNHLLSIQQLAKIAAD